MVLINILVNLLPIIGITVQVIFSNRIHQFLHVLGLLIFYSNFLLVHGRPIHDVRPQTKDTWIDRGYFDPSRTLGWLDFPFP